MEAIIFDFGNVICNFDPYQIYGTVTQSKAEQDLLYNTLMESNIWHYLDRGDDPSQLIRQAKEDLPPHLHQAVDTIFSTWHYQLENNPEMAKLIEELIDKNKKVYLLSNISEQVQEIKHNFPIFEKMDGLFFSYQVRMIKPDPEIYQAFLERYDLQAEQCYFIDDKAENIEGAQAIGINGYVYDGNIEKLKNQLKQLRIL